MSEEKRSTTFDRRKKKPRQTVNIQFARSLSSQELIALLQEKLILARSATPPEREVELMTEIVHDIKFRLAHYARLFGEVDRAEYDNGRDDD